MSEEKKYPIMGYAPGGYYCTCITCKSTFLGDRDAYQCEACADNSQAEWDALTPEQQQERVEKNAAEFQKWLKENW